MDQLIRQLQATRAELDILERLLLEAQEAPKPKREPTGPQADPADGGEYLTVHDLAGRYHVSPATIYRWAREGRFPKGRYWGPRTRRWSLADLQ